MTPDTFWRVDHVTGSDDALDELAGTVADAEYYNLVVVGSLRTFRWKNCPTRSGDVTAVGVQNPPKTGSVRVRSETASSDIRKPSSASRPRLAAVFGSVAPVTDEALRVVSVRATRPSPISVDPHR